MSKRTANISTADLQPTYIRFQQMIYFMRQEETHALIETQLQKTFKIQQSRSPSRGNNFLGFSKSSLICFPTGFASTHQSQLQSCHCQLLHHRSIFHFQHQQIHSSCQHWTVKPASKLQTDHGQHFLFPIHKRY